jgi:hypothetical protein
MKRIVIFILILAILVGGGVWLYKRHQANVLSPTGATPTGSLFPTGNSTVPYIEGTLPDGITADGSTSVTSPFKKLSFHPIAGYDFFIQKTTITTPATTPKGKPTIQTISTPLVRYVSRSNGYVYELEGDEPALQVSNVYIPNIYETLFGDNGGTALLRFLRPDQRTVATYSVPVPAQNPDGTRTQKSGTYFPDNIGSIAVSPDGTQTVRVVPSATLGGVVTIASTTNTKQVELYHSLFREWLVSWPTAKTIYLQTKASATVPGYLYGITQTDKKLRRVVGNVNGLTASVSPSGKYVLYSESSGSSFSTRLLNTTTGAVKNFNLSILPEKCTWLANEDLICAGNSSVAQATYPDDWYKSTVTFSDQLYHIYTTTSIYDVLYDNSARSFDMTNIQVDETRRIVFFIDKPTGLLWQFSY